MSKIFVEFSLGIGPMSRCLPLLLKLKENGHIISYFSHKECITYMNELGFEKIDIEESLTAATSIIHDWINADEFWGRYGFSNINWFEQELNKWIDKISLFKPDLIISDLGVFSSVVANILNIPLVSITQSCYHPRSPYVVQRYWQYESIPNNTLITINKIIEKKGGTPFSKFEDIFVGDITLITSLPELDVLKDDNINDCTYYVGPIAWEAEKGSFNFQQENLKFKKRIFGYIGQIRNNGVELKFCKILNQIAYNNHYKIIISTGGNSNKINSNIEEFPNLTFVNWISMEAAYKNSDLVICHGGHQSCIGLLVYGVPGLILGTHTEREFNGRLIENLGIGMNLDSQQINYKTVEDKLHNLLNDVKFYNKAQSYKCLIEEKYSNSVDVAYNYIISLLPKT